MIDNKLNRYFVVGTGNHKASRMVSETYIDNHFIMMMTNGSQEVFVDNERIFVPNQHYIYIPPNSIYRAHNEKKCSFFWLHVYNHEKDDSEIKKLERCSPIIRPTRVEELLQLLVMYQADGLSEETASFLLLHAVMAELSSKKQSQTVKSYKKLAVMARTQILSNLTEDIGTREIADALNCNPDHLGRIFRGVFNKTITEFIHQMRIVMSKRFLHMADRSISDVGKSCGFSDPVYFNRVFKKIVGETPGQYQKKHIKDVFKNL